VATVVHGFEVLPVRTQVPLALPHLRPLLRERGEEGCAQGLVPLLKAVEQQDVRDLQEHVNVHALHVVQEAALLGLESVYDRAEGDKQPDILGGGELGFALLPHCLPGLDGLHEVVVVLELGVHLLHIALLLAQQDAKVLVALFNLVAETNHLRLLRLGTVAAQQLFCVLENALVQVIAALALHVGD